MSTRKQLFPFAALSASYFAHIGFFNPYLPLWLKELGFGLIAIAVLTSVQSGVWPVLRQPPVRWFFAAVFFHVLAHIFIYIFFSLYLDSLGYSKTVIGLLWALSVVIEIGWFFTQGRWLPLFSLSGWLVLAAALMSLRMGLTAGLPLVMPVLLLAQALHAITFAAHHTVCIAMLSHHFPGRLRGRGQALYTVVGYGLPGVAGGLVGGLLSSAFGLASVFWLSSACAAVACLCAWRARFFDQR